MTAEEYRTAVYDVIYLASCAINGKKPDIDRTGKMDLSLVFKTAQRHLLDGITAAALQSAGIRDTQFTQAWAKAVRRTASFNEERTAILSEMDKAGIWYMPLKGCVLQDMYPGIGMRQMADNDILFDDSRTGDLRKIMESRGFEVGKNFGLGVHDTYTKPPFFNFEMHRALFGTGHVRRIVEYYKDIKSRLLRTEGTECGYHMSDEDLYVYLIAHEYKHYSNAGTGLRSLLDTYVFLREKVDSLDRGYINAELEKLRISEFEEKNRRLSMQLFSGEETDGLDDEMLEYVISSGTYGTVQNRVKNKVGGYGGGSWGKIRYALSRVFLPLETVRTGFPVFYKYPVLLPFLPLFRLFRGLIRHSGRLKSELKALGSYKEDQDNKE